MKKLFCVCISFILLILSSCSWTEFPSPGTYKSEDPYFVYVDNQDTGGSAEMLLDDTITTVILSLGFDGTFIISQKVYRESLTNFVEEELFRGEFYLDAQKNLVLKFDQTGKIVKLIKQ